MFIPILLRELPGTGPAQEVFYFYSQEGLQAFGKCRPQRGQTKSASYQTCPLPACLPAASPTSPTLEAQGLITGPSYPYSPLLLSSVNHCFGVHLLSLASPLSNPTAAPSHQEEMRGERFERSARITRGRLRRRRPGHTTQQTDKGTEFWMSQRLSWDQKPEPLLLSADFRARPGVRGSLPGRLPPLGSGPAIIPVRSATGPRFRGNTSS